ncbi:hypothetical protein PAXINDRAFT_136327 [Paxillus involutus ATCC 200175]|uniref:Uncharacterized protein n=1 Tax=Paxillus involutus ATCC 200175 TaxID=664439 RepID=A0A0C9SVF9_PAXIN|nr:hypothetical protein PAXINDRAFT_136327 [Paxillus involutus ATCC 200175]
MPLRYRRESPPRERPPSDIIEPTDADDSIVLSDLLRTGEASRLRRRGAMRLDHNQMSAQRNEGGRATPPTVVVARTPSWIEPPSDDDESTQTWEQGYDPGLSSRPESRSVAGLDTYGYTLYCGGEEPSSLLVQRSSPCERSPLPSYPPAPSRINQRKHDVRLQTNGCGAVIHLRASRRGGSSVWVGKDEATSAVVPMDPSYFERSAVVRMMSSACGCLREGVGCAICGNTLGTRYKPCQAAAEGLFSPQYTSHVPLCPQGPRYWHGQPSSPTAESTSLSYIYTFFASNVICGSSIPTARGTIPSSPQESFYTAGNPFDLNFFDRLVSASPLPMTEDDRTASEQGSRSQTELQFDPDGAPLPSDPGSPDKTGTELMLLPER